MPKYFGFEAAGVLLRDIKTDHIFAIYEMSKDETEKALRDQFTAKMKKMEKYEKEKCGSKYVPIDIDTYERLEQEYVNSVTSDFRETMKISYANN